MAPPPSSLGSSASSIQKALANIIGHKAKISIMIDNHYAAKVYTSNSTVAGHVVINAGSKDLRFDHLRITLNGLTKTRVDNTRGTQTRKCQFLEIQMPVAEDSYPVPRVYEADQTYQVPFTFVIPESHFADTCKLHGQNAGVQEHHRALPPSMGRWLKNDMAPDMAQVDYTISAKLVLEANEREGNQLKKKTVTLLEETHSINVLPAFPEQPPLDLTKRDKEYVMAKTKSIKKGLFSNKSGELTVRAAQPAAVMLSADGRAALPTQVTLHLRFDPSGTESPTPKILHVGRKVTAQTYFSLAGIGDMPNLGDWVKTYGIDGRGAYESAVGLADWPARHMEWTQDLHARSRRDSGYGSEEHVSSSENTVRRPTASPFSYSMTLNVPVHLPVESKTFLPTFHWCLVSRVYILALSVVVSLNNSNTTLTVRVPLQIGVESAQQPTLGDPAVPPPSFEAAVEEAAIEGPSVPNRGELPAYSRSP